MLKLTMTANLGGTMHELNMDTTPQLTGVAGQADAAGLLPVTADTAGETLEQTLQPADDFSPPVIPEGILHSAGPMEFIVARQALRRLSGQSSTRSAAPRPATPTNSVFSSLARATNQALQKMGTLWKRPDSRHAQRAQTEAMQAREAERQKQLAETEQYKIDIERIFLALDKISKNHPGLKTMLEQKRPAFIGGLTTLWLAYLKILQLNDTDTLKKFWHNLQGDIHSLFYFGEIRTKEDYPKEFDGNGFRVGSLAPPSAYDRRGFLKYQNALQDEKQAPWIFEWLSTSLQREVEEMKAEPR